MDLFKQGAEARLYKIQFMGRDTVTKERFSKKYRHPTLDELLTKDRTKTEAKYLQKCRKIGICTPTLYFLDLNTNSLYLENIVGTTVCEFIQASGDDQAKMLELAQTIGSLLGTMHYSNIIHGDLTTSNMLLKKNASLSERNSIVFIDFGLSQTSSMAEDKGVDLYVLERAVLSTHQSCEYFVKAILDSYVIENKTDGREVIKKLDEIRLRGRKRTMIG